ncbi:MAG TPA: potassium-transporting ATPase subunit KdpA [Acidimicrobiia bacterium]
MSAPTWAQFALLAGLVLLLAPVMGRYMAAVFGGGHAPGDRVFLPLERVIYRLVGIDQDREQRWTRYAGSLLVFSFVSIVVLYAIQRLQGSLPFNPDHRAALNPFMSLNNAASFTTNTDWQSYVPESTVSIFTQTVGIVFQNFMSAATGLAVAVALIRGLARRKADTIGNFWVDITRAVTRILLPISFVLAIFFMSQGVIQNFHSQRSVAPVDRSLVAAKTDGQAAAKPTVPGGPVASQEAIKELGSNGGGYFNANSAHPFESPTGLTNFVQMLAAAIIAFGLPFTFGRLVGSRRQGYVLFGVMLVLWAVPMVGTTYFETHGNPRLTAAGADQKARATQGGGNLEGKEVRSGAAGAAMHGSDATSTSTGSVAGSHDSFTPLGGGIVMTNILTGEYGPGGVGSGLYGLLVMALVAVFIAGLMVGRTPGYLGKKIRAPDVKLATIYVLFVPFVVLTFAGITVLLSTATSAVANTGAHGFSEMLYSYASAGNNNGSAFPGITVTSHWYEITLTVAILMGRFLLIVPVLAIAGGSARKQPAPPTAGTFPTDGVLFGVLLVFVVVIVVSLTYLPALALGPIVEHLSL